MKYTTRGARLIEVNCRMGGMFVRDHNLLCWGVDLVEEHLLATVGIGGPPPKAAAPLRASAGVYTSTERSGVVRDAAVLAEYARAAASPDAEFAYFRPLVQEGDGLQGPRDASDFPTWLHAARADGRRCHRARAACQR
eukprot:6432619-Prymnesium_polylepis.2